MIFYQFLHSINLTSLAIDSFSLCSSRSISLVVKQGQRKDGKRNERWGDQERYKYRKRQPVGSHCSLASLLGQVLPVRLCLGLLLSPLSASRPVWPPPQALAWLCLGSRFCREPWRAELWDSITVCCAINYSISQESFVSQSVTLLRNEVLSDRPTCGGAAQSWSQEN